MTENSRRNKRIHRAAYRSKLTYLCFKYLCKCYYCGQEVTRKKFHRPEDILDVEEWYLVVRVADYINDELSFSTKRILRASVEHLLPVSEGGDNRDENLVLACRFCNCKRHSNASVMKLQRICIACHKEFSPGKNARIYCKNCNKMGASWARRYYNGYSHNELFYSGGCGIA